MVKIKTLYEYIFYNKFQASFALSERPLLDCWLLISYKFQLQKNHAYSGLEQVYIVDTSFGRIIVDHHCLNCQNTSKLYRNKGGIGQVMLIYTGYNVSTRF